MFYTSSGADGDMLNEILGNVIAKGFCISQSVMDHDTAAPTFQMYISLHIFYIQPHCQIIPL